MTKNDKNYIRDIFDEISLSLINFLENHEGVTNVQFFEIGGCTDEDFQKWSDNNSPYELPNDFKSFLGISDGLLLRWNIQINNTNVPLGNMHINSLENVIRRDHPLSSNNKSNKNSELAAFTIDCSSSGAVAFVYTSKTDKSPKIYFQDLADEWHYICENFIEYFRLMVLHMGVPNWQYVFTDIGLDEITKVWLRFLSPKRFLIDQVGRRTEKLNFFTKNSGRKEIDKDIEEEEEEEEEINDLDHKKYNIIKKKKMKKLSTPVKEKKIIRFNSKKLVDSISKFRKKSSSGSSSSNNKENNDDNTGGSSNKRKGKSSKTATSRYAKYNTGRRY